MKREAAGGGGERRGAPRDARIENRLCISVTEAAKMICVSRNFMYELVRTKQVPAIKFGKRILIPRIKLEKLLEEGGQQ